ncbi:MAG: hypothetical protein IJN80_06405 [Clostridia bacterium]|nr:hypothetical protein [Clostridia bacterium]
MKLRKDPLFIGAALCLFFPIGFILLLRSDCKKKYKIIFSLLGALLFLALTISLGTIKNKAPMPDYQLIVSKDTLKVGESGSLAVMDGNHLYSDITIDKENDCLSLQGTVFTAEKIGSCLLTATYGEEQDTVEIHITADDGGNEIVYCSAKGAKYHRTKSHGGKNSVEMSREDAVQSAKTPCKICYPTF